MRRAITCLIAAILALGGASLAAAASPATPAGGAIAGQQMVNIPNGYPIALSPDGRRLAVWLSVNHAIQLCAYTTDTLAAEHCADFPGHSIEEDTAAWSPDSTRLAFTENGSKYGDESDLWLFDAGAGTVTDLTDDGLGNDAVFDVGTPLDFAPAWSPDGTRLAFARGLKTGEDADGEDIENTTLYTIAATGGDPTPLAKVADYSGAVESGIRWPAAGLILYSIVNAFNDATIPTLGVWALPAAGNGPPEQIVSAADSDLDIPNLVGTAGTNGLLLDNDGAFALLNLTTDALQALDTPDDSAIFAATLSPDGSKLLYDAKQGLFLRDLATGQDQQIGKLDSPIGSKYDRSGLAWGTNGVVFALGPGATGVLFGLPAQ